MTVIELEDLCKFYEGGDIKAADNVNLEIRDGEFMTLLGPSGCGKTTILRLIAGLETPTKGDVYFDDENVTEMAPSKRNVAMVFQNYAIYPHMSVRENIEYPLKVRDVQKDKRTEKVEEAARFLEIEELLDRSPDELSGGQRQRVALGRAVVRDPTVFLLDEPLANLDAKLRVRMRSEMKKLLKDLGTTTVYVTHDQEEAMTMSERVAVINSGSVEQVDEPTQLYQRPRTRWVADFIGSPSMNLIDCDLVERGGQKILDSEHFSVAISDGLAEKIDSNSSGSGLTLGIRPGDFIVSEEKPDIGICGELHTLEPLGEFTIVNVQVDDLMLKAKVDQFSSEEVSEIYLTFDEDDVYLYDENGDLIE